MTITQYLHNQDRLHNTLFRIDATGKGYFILGDQRFTREEFSKMFPLPISFVSHNGGNADKSKSYLYTD